MNLLNGYLKGRMRVILTVTLVLVMAACGDSTPEGVEPTEQGVWFQSTGTTQLTAKGYANDPQIILSGDTGAVYTMSVTQGSQWCWTSRKTQSTTREGVLATSPDYTYIYLAANNSGTQREAEVTVAFAGGASFVLSITQQPLDIPASYDKEWAELPVYEGNDDWQYVTHYAPLSSTKTARNFTICYDKQKRVANWVAYPLSPAYMQGSYSRSDAWGYDPDVAKEYQADLDGRSYAGGYIRGHQCMSNHRYVSYSRELNAQTFYSTNIMPQNSSFNSGSWLTMEGVATQKSCADTLYVVTGTYGVRGYATDQNGLKIAAPEYCWKVLLRTRNGSTGKRVGEFTDASQLMAIGFWAENSSSSKQWSASYLKSVHEIEELTGYTFFPMLDASVSESVKAQKNPSQWGI